MLRAFADLPLRQVHYRRGGDGGVPLLMLHASPGSGKQLLALASSLACGRRVIVPDRAGAGDSEPLQLPEPDIADFARAELELLDSLGAEQVDVYGSHTGACIAVEMALLAPTRVRRLVLDGIGLFSADEAALYLRRYAPPLAPDLAGTHLAFVFQFCRDQALFFPWFEAKREAARGGGLPPPGVLHDLVVEVLKCLSTYHLGYHASFRYDARARLGLLRQPVLALCTQADPLRHHVAEAAVLVAHAVSRIVPEELRAAAIIEFL
jgi:pimeloyl-ACP methyl ester carboxylesterase